MRFSLPVIPRRETYTGPRISDMRAATARLRSLRWLIIPTPAPERNFRFQIPGGARTLRQLRNVNPGGLR